MWQKIAPLRFVLFDPTGRSHSAGLKYDDLYFPEISDLILTLPRFVTDEILWSLVTLRQSIAANEQNNATGYFRLVLTLTFDWGEQVHPGMKSGKKH